MTYHGRFGADGVCRFRKPFFRAVRCTVEAEGDFSLCHLRDGSGDYLATIERDGRIRESLVFNVYHGGFPPFDGREVRSARRVPVLGEAVL